MSSDKFACIEYNITNSSWHFGPNSSLWTSPSPTKIVYGPQLRFGQYNILWVTSRSINCHMALSAMNYLLNNSFLVLTCGQHLHDDIISV